ncbi:MAG: hypothetical protein QXH30_03255 [Candidatus Bilamarchaeaceae archaeon]
MRAKDEFRGLFIPYTAWNAGLGIGGSLLFFYLAALGYSVVQMLTLLFIMYLVPTLMLIIPRHVETETSLAVGAVSQGLAYAAFAYFGGSAFGLIVLSVVGSLCFLFFWTPFNSMWFALEGRGKAGQGAVAIGIPVILGVALPFITGLVAEQMGYSAVYWIAAAVLFLCAWLAYKMIPSRRFTYPLRESLNEFKNFRTLSFLEGLAGTATYTLMGIITIKYFSDPVGFGAFGSLAMVLAVAATMLFAKISDQKQKRREFVIIFALGLGISSVLAAFVQDIYLWFVVTVLVNFFRIIFFPFPLAVMLDVKKDVPRAVYAREIMLNLGRSFGFLLAIALYMGYGNLQVPLAVIGLSPIAYAGVYELVKRKEIELRH